MSYYANLATPNTFATMNSSASVDTGLKLKAINKKLQIESTLDDIFDELGGNVVSSGNVVNVPNAIFFQLGAQPTGARTVVVPMLKVLSGSLNLGAPVPGNEVNQDLKYAEFNYGEYYFTVASQNWGKTANEMAMYGVFEQIQPSLSKYFKELRGQRIREAGLRRYDDVATNGGSLSQHWNQNWFIANTDLGDQPTYDSTESDFRSAITTATTAAGGSGDGVDANIDLNSLLSLDYYVSNTLRLDPIMVGGKKTYVVLIPSSQVQILKRPDSGQLGSIWSQMNRDSGDEMKYTGYIGRVGSLMLIEDQRYPTLTESGGAFTVEYVHPGNTDSRNSSVYNGSSNKAWDIGYVLGQGAIVEWVVRKEHFEIEKQNYGYNQGTGVFAEGGIQALEFDVDSGTDATRENYSSAIIAFTHPAITA